MPIVSSVAKSLPPSGTAGGDLGGTYPNPTVDLMAGGTITGTVVLDNAAAQMETDLSGETIFMFNDANTTEVELSGAVTAHLAMARPVADGTAWLRCYTLGQTKSYFKVLGGPGAEGAVVTGANAAPADGELVNGECALWFDADAVTPALKVKARDSGGTIRTATVLLA